MASQKQAEAFLRALTGICGGDSLSSPSALPSASPSDSPPPSASSSALPSPSDSPSSRGPERKSYCADIDSVLSSPYKERPLQPRALEFRKRPSRIRGFPFRRKLKSDSIISTENRNIPPPPGSVFNPFLYDEGATSSQVSQDETMGMYTAGPANLQHATKNKDMNSSSDKDDTVSMLYTNFWSPPADPDPDLVKGASPSDSPSPFALPSASSDSPSPRGPERKLYRADIDSVLSSPYKERPLQPRAMKLRKRPSSIQGFPLRRKLKSDSIISTENRKIPPPPGRVFNPFLDEGATSSQVSQDETMGMYTAGPANLQHATKNNDMNSSSDNDDTVSMLFPHFSSPLADPDPDLGKGASLSDSPSPSALPSASSDSPSSRGPERKSCCADMDPVISSPYKERPLPPRALEFRIGPFGIWGFPPRRKLKSDSIISTENRNIPPPPGSVFIPFLDEGATSSQVSQDETMGMYTAGPANLQHATKNKDMNSSSDKGDTVPSRFTRFGSPLVKRDRGLVKTDAAVRRTCEEFTPDENDEDYRFLCSSPGQYKCSVTGLVFDMEGEGEVVYRTVPWDRKLLAQNRKKPAGPLFDIKCVQQSVCRLHLPHCEISSMGGFNLLSVAHVEDEGVEFINPHVVTESHVIINVTRFSGYGNVKDEDSPPDPVRALVLLFYTPPADPDPESLLNVLLLPRNVVLRDVQRVRKKTVGDEIYLETSPYCKLHPGQEYTLSTCPEDDTVLVQPKEAEFYYNYDNFFPSFQVHWQTKMKHMKLTLTDTNTSNSVWDRLVHLLFKGFKRSRSASALNLPPTQRLQRIRSDFVDRISGPVLKSLLDRLFERTVITDAERESAEEIQNTRDKARVVIDTVRKKGEAASSVMIDFLCEADPFLCEHLGLV